MQTHRWSRLAFCLQTLLLNRYAAVLPTPRFSGSPRLTVYPPICSSIPQLSAEGLLSATCCIQPIAHPSHWVMRQRAFRTLALGC